MNTHIKIGAYFCLSSRICAYFCLGSRSAGSLNYSVRLRRMVEGNL